jgi:RNA polymerase sigma factor for flagellar operon FliA
MGFSLVSDKEDIFQYLNSGDNASATNVAKLKELENSLAEAISQLNKKEKIVLSLYYWEELTMKEIGEIMEVTESRVSQIHSKAIVRLRGKIRRMGFS